jgi:hypothetical protein
MTVAEFHQLQLGTYVVLSLGTMGIIECLVSDGSGLTCNITVRDQWGLLTTMHLIQCDKVTIISEAEYYGRNTSEENKVQCTHEFVNVGFTSLKLVCKKCNQEK